MQCKPWDALALMMLDLVLLIELFERVYECRPLPGADLRKVSTRQASH